MKIVGFIGLGLMGGPMAANIARAGYPLTVWNRTAAKAEPLRELGAQVAGSPRGVAENSEVVITMLADAAAVEAVMLGEDGVVAGIREGTVVIDMSTIAPDQSLIHAAEFAAFGVKMLDAPVSGSTGPAQEGTLGILVGGDKAVFDAHRDLLAVMGEEIFYLGPQGSGTTAKLCINLMVAAQVASLSEALAFARRGGLDLNQMRQVITLSGINSALIEAKTGKMVEGVFQPAFPLKHMHKDLGLMVRTAEDLGVSIPATSVVHQLYTAAGARGHGEEDFAAIYRLLAEMAGLSA